MIKVEYSVGDIVKLKTFDVIMREIANGYMYTYLDLRVTKDIVPLLGNEVKITELYGEKFFDFDGYNARLSVNVIDKIIKKVEPEKPLIIKIENGELVAKRGVDEVTRKINSEDEYLEVIKSVLDELKRIKNETPSYAKDKSVKVMDLGNTSDLEEFLNTFF